MINVKELKVGDLVGVCPRSNYQRCEVLTVARVTATQVKLSDGSRWTHRGYEVGASSWNTRHLMDVQDAERSNQAQDERRARQRLLDLVQSLNFSVLSDEQLHAVLAIANEPTADENASHDADDADDPAPR